MNSSEVHPSRKILLVVTTGGFTHAGPVLEVGRTLAARGHTIEFATLEGQENWVRNEEYEFVTKVHLLGAGPTEDQLEAHYRRSQKWDVSKGLGASMESKYLFDSFWPQTYHGLKGIMDDPATRPDMMIADFFVDAVKDIHVEYQLPIAVVWPNMPFLMMPCSYIPGQPGFQLEGTLTSETASMWLRIKNELVVLTGLRAILKWVNWTKQMRRDNAVYYPTHRPQKPDYLILVNSFFGLEIPRDLPPTCAPIGPLLSPTYPPLDTSCEEFLGRHRSVLYIGLGTHIILPNKDAIKIINGVMRLMQEGLIDGVIWAIGKKSRQDLDGNQTFQIKTNSSATKLSELLANKHPDWLLPFFAPQRAILDHESTKLYFTHGGGSSANEALYHGKPLIAMGFFFDQIANTTRLVAAGVAESLNKFRFTSDELYAKAKQILQSDKNNHKSYLRNVLRMKRIAHIAAHRRNHAADLVEELMYDNELRFSPGDQNGGGRELRPMHLQTADMRMPAYKAKNWDLYAVCVLGTSVLMGSTWFAGRLLWTFRAPLVEQVQLMVGEGLRRVFK
ncbi:UDP-glucosyl transferase [Aspergillus sclerotialis]|uniref:UDP-glucosyl transferase n=1 Tax=Aspergillus sclerotialis TaxID=2070753 RepID=A0A3A2ZK20_9EURO|nr:UDP-glucosyl transferase [Aspergillus sclerotialis]